MIRWLKLPDINGVILTINAHSIGAIWPGQKEKVSHVTTISGKDKVGMTELEDDNTRCNILISGYVLAVKTSAILVQTLVDQALLQQNKEQVNDKSLYSDTSITR